MPILSSHCVQGNTKLITYFPTLGKKLNMVNSPTLSCQKKPDNSGDIVQA